LNYIIDFDYHRHIKETERDDRELEYTFQPSMLSMLHPANHTIGTIAMRKGGCSIFNIPETEQFPIKRQLHIFSFYFHKTMDTTKFIMSQTNEIRDSNTKNFDS
jgi:hypothetical protein